MATSMLTPLTISALTFTTSVISSDAYVLLQVRKHDNNHSKIDALIHKVVSSDKFNEFARKMADKQITIVNKPKKGEPTRENSKTEESDKETYFMVKAAADNELDGKLEDLTHNADPDVMSRNAEQFGDNQPKLRTHRDVGKGESSLLYEVSAGSVVRAVGELLSSSAVREYVDSLSKQAAVVYRTMNEH